MAPFDSRFHLVSDSARVDVCRSLGYPLALGSLDVTTHLFVELLGQRNTPVFDYLTPIVREDAELVARVFRNTARRQAVEAMLGSEKRAAVWRAMRASTEKCRKRIREQERSNDIERTLRANIAAAKRVDLEDEEGYFLEVLADYYFSTENDTMGVECLRESFRNRLLSGNIPLASSIADRIGTHYLRKGDFVEAESWFLESLRNAGVVGDSYHLSRSFTFLASLRSKEGRLVEADSLLSEAIACGRELKDPHLLPPMLVDMARLSLDRGEQSRALTLCQEAIEQNGRCLAEPSLNRDPLLLKTIRWSRAEAYSIKASIFLDLGKSDAAIAAMNLALADAKETIDRRFEASLRAQLGRTLLAAGRDGEALRSFSKALRTARKLRESDRETEYLQAIAEVHLARSEGAKAEDCLDDALRTARQSSSPELVISVLARISELRRSRGDVQGATEMLERSIAVFERERARKRHSWNARELRVGMTRVFSELLLIKKDRPAEIDSLLFYAEKARALLGGEHRADGIPIDRLIGLRTGSTEWIPENALVVQYIATPDTLIIIGTERGGSTCRSIPVSRGDVDARVSAFVGRCIALGTRGAGTAPGDLRAIEAQSRDLSRLLLAPVESLAASKEVLCFIPDESLRRLPLAALLEPNGAPRFLLEDKSIVVSTSLAALGPREAAQGPRAAESSGRVRLLIGDPQLGHEVKRRYPHLAELPNAYEEIMEAESALGGGMLLAGRSATKVAALAAFQRSEQIHIAAHTVLFAGSGAEAAIVLSPAPNDTTLEASLLSESEIRKLDLSRTRLVVLAVCQAAGRGESERTDERGIAGAFLDAGANTVVATLWPVEDSAARRFMQVYYEELSRGDADAARSLRRAQETFIRTGRSTGSIFNGIQIWAPYICFDRLKSAK